MPTCQLPGITRHNQGESAILRYEDNPSPVIPADGTYEKHSVWTSRS